MNIKQKMNTDRIIKSTFKLYDQMPYWLDEFLRSYLRIRIYIRGIMVAKKKNVQPLNIYWVNIEDINRVMVQIGRAHV